MSAGHSLVAVQDNLIDAIWTDRPERPSTQLRVLGLEYTGQWARTLDRRSVAVSSSMCCRRDKRVLTFSWCDVIDILMKPDLEDHLINISVFPGMSWQEKVTALRAKMTERKITWFVATALDEIACMFSHKYAVQSQLTLTGYSSLSRMSFVYLSKRKEKNISPIHALGNFFRFLLFTIIPNALTFICNCVVNVFGKL